MWVLKQLEFHQPEEVFVTKPAQKKDPLIGVDTNLNRSLKKILDNLSYLEELQQNLLARDLNFTPNAEELEWRRRNRTFVLESSPAKRRTNIRI